MFKHTWLAHLHERQEMHPLVVAFLKQRLDPSVIALESSKAMEMSQHPGYHARNTGDGLEEQEADHPLRLGQGLDGVGGGGRVQLVDLLLAAHPRASVHTPATETHELPGKIISPCLRLAVGRHHL